MTTCSHDRALISSAISDLAGFLADADQLMVGGKGRWASGHDILPDDSAEPLRVLLRLRTQAAHEFHAIFKLIDDPMATPAAEVVLRGLLANLAHMYWIYQGEPFAGDRSRGDREKTLPGSALGFRFRCVLPVHLSRAWHGPQLC